MLRWRRWKRGRRSRLTAVFVAGPGSLIVASGLAGLRTQGSCLLVERSPELFG